MIVTRHFSFNDLTSFTVLKNKTRMMKNCLISLIGLIAISLKNMKI